MKNSRHDDDTQEDERLSAEHIYWREPSFTSESMVTRDKLMKDIDDKHDTGSEGTSVKGQDFDDVTEPHVNNTGPDSNLDELTNINENRRGVLQSSFLPFHPKYSSVSLRKRKDQKVVGLKDALLSQSTSSANTKTVEEQEKEARLKSVRNPLFLMITGNVAAMKIFLYYLVTIETLFVLALTTGMTLYWYLKYKDEPTGNWGARYMDWFIVGFAVVGPMSASLTMSFNRRESALMRLSQVRSYAYHIYLGHALWDWNNGRGRASCKDIDWVHHTDAVMAQLIGIGDELSRFLTLPTATRSRHRMTNTGREEAIRTMRVAYTLYDSLSTLRLTRLTSYAESLKAAGLGASEISRIRQYERWMGEAMDSLRQFKLYRTPQALRSFARIFTLILPPFYAPTFAALAIEVKSLGVGLCMGILTTLALMALFESIQVMEDPFVAYLTLDGIDVREELEVMFWQQLVDTRHLLFPTAPPYPEAPREALRPGKALGVASIVTFGDNSDQDPELGILRTAATPAHHRLKSYEIPLGDLSLDNASTHSTKSHRRLRLHSTEGPSVI